MPAITTAMPTSFKKEMLEGAHNLQGTITVAGTTTSTSKNITATTLTDLSPGMAVSDANGDVPANTFTSALLSSTSIKMDTAATGSHAGQNITFKGDSLAFALIKQGYAGTYGAASTNYSDITGNSDEAEASAPDCHRCP